MEPKAWKAVDEVWRGVILTDSSLVGQVEEEG